MAEKLTAYAAKRDFSSTPEPRGGAASPGRLRYVVQRHAARREHYDFRLEWGGTLLSWAVPKGPSMNPADKRLAVRVEDHPPDYRNFEGVIPKGQYGGGTVMLWDEGTWEPQADVDAGLANGALKLTLHGTRLGGDWALVRMKPRAGEKGENWLLIKEKDTYARPGAAQAADAATSVRTGRTMAEIAAGAAAKGDMTPVTHLEPQLCKLVDAVPKGNDWIFEVKYDGYRILADISGGGVRLISRGGNDYTDRFPAVAAALARWAGGRAMVLDGEMVVTDSSGKTDFQALQGYMKHPRGKSPVYMVFDLLALDGQDVRPKPLLERRATLEALLAGAPPTLAYSRHVAGNGAACLQAACRTGLEGIIAKRVNSPYSGTRNGDWVKVKCERRQELIIGGFTRTEKKQSGVSALLLGYYAAGKLVYAGRAGSGIARAEGEGLAARFAKLARKTPPFTNPPKPRAGELVTWLTPKLVAEIRFAEMTDEGLLRQASFKGLREDKGAAAVRLEQPAPVAEVAITHPDRVVFPDTGITKAHVAAYYRAVAARMLPYVGGRLLSTVRCPKGVGAACFFKKHPGPGGAHLTPVQVKGSSGDKTYFCIRSPADLVAEAQMGALEFHIWGSRADSPEQPDMMVFDLDPDVGMDLESIRQGARDVRDVLAGLGLEAFLKTSGGKGYHLVVPLAGGAPWERFYSFAKGVAALMSRQWPQRYTDTVRKAQRRDRIFIDALRNGRGATSVAPYSLRARPGAPVSMPIGWDELDTVAPDGITLQDALARLDKPDPWADFFAARQGIKK